MPGPTRRDVLKAGAAAVVGGMVARGAYALADEGGGAGPWRFALVTDTHLGLYGTTDADRLRAAVGEINASGAEFTIFCGDLVNAGAKPENERWYPEWKAIVAGLRRPWYAVPGNHDPDRLFLRHIAEATDFTVDRPPFRFVCFRDAILAGGSHDGVVTTEQVEWIGRQVDEAWGRGMRAVLVSHVIYHDNAKPDRGWRITEGREALARMLAERPGRVAAFFAGHFHNGLRGWDDTPPGVHEVVLPSLSWNADAKLRGAPGYCLDEFRPGYVMVEATEGELVLGYKPVGEAVKESKRLDLGR